MIKTTKLALLSMVFLASTVQAVKVTYVSKTFPATLDPMQLYNPIIRIANNMYFDPLIRYDHNMNIEMRLAKSYERINNNTLRFRLVENAVFHSGNPFTADDVIYSFNRMKKSRSLSRVANPFSDVKKIDTYTVDFIEKEPFALTLPILTNMMIMDSKFYQGKDEISSEGESFAASNVSGTGFFKVNSFDKTAKRLLLEKNVNYWDKNAGNVTRLDWSAETEDALRNELLVTGKADVIFHVPEENLADYRRNKKFTLLNIPSDRIFFLGLNGDVKKEFKDVNVRQALFYAIDENMLARRVLRNAATPAAQLSPKLYKGHNDSYKPGFSVSEAKKLLAEANVTHFSPTILTSQDYNERMIISVVSMLERIGITPTIQSMPSQEFFNMRTKCQQDMHLLAISTITGDSQDYGSYILHSKDGKLGQHNCGYSNKDLDALIEKSVTETDEKARVELLQQVTALSYKEMPVIPLYWENHTWAYKNNFKGFEKIVNTLGIQAWDKLKVK